MAKLICIGGDRSGAGKSTVCMGIISGLLKDGYQPSDVAYIKPCTQCEDVQLISKFCESKGIAHQGIGPVRFVQGWTYKVIDQDPHAHEIEDLHAKIKLAVEQIAEGRKVVLVDGVGYPAVGSVAGISNGQIAQLLGAPVVLVGPYGVGNAIDSFHLNQAFYEKYKVQVLGAVFNNLPTKPDGMSSYHTYEKCKEYVTKFFEKFEPDTSVYGFIPRLDSQWLYAEEKKKSNAGVVCVLRTPKASLVLTEEEQKLCDEIEAHAGQYLDVKKIVSDINQYYEKTA